MTSYDRRLQILAACLSALAGYVDAIGFLSLNGYFVSFMSGNSTQMAVGIAQGAASALIAAALVAVFVLGVMAGSVTAALAKAQRRPAVLVLVSLLLAAAATCGVFGGLKLSIVCMTLAMGAENAVFERDGEVHVGVTYMTGTFKARPAPHGRSARRHTVRLAPVSRSVARPRRRRGRRGHRLSAPRPGRLVACGRRSRCLGVRCLPDRIAAHPPRGRSVCHPGRSEAEVRDPGPPRSENNALR